MSQLIAKNLPVMLNGAYRAFQRARPGGDLAPSTDTGGALVTHCNQFIQSICNGIGYSAFNGMLANEMFDFMTNPANGWISVDGTVAQSHANDGALVILAYKNPNPGHHGHVCLVLQGLGEPSATFGKEFPRIASVGRSVGWGVAVDSIFNPSESIVFFALNAMIS